MLSRVAESVYWMARYIERAENTARLVSVYTQLLLDLPARAAPGWRLLVDIAAAPQRFAGLYAEADERNVVRFLLGDLRNPDSVLSALCAARENARTVREVFPREAWEQLNELYLAARGELAGGLTQRRRYAYLRMLILGSQQLTGLLDGTMTHDAAYDFLGLGRNIERADMTTRILDVNAAHLAGAGAGGLEGYENLLWMSVLKSLSAYQMYRREMQAPVARAAVLRFLLHDTRFPRAIGYALAEAEACLRRLPRAAAPLAALAAVAAALRAEQPEALSAQALRELVDRLQLGLIALDGAVGETYFRLAVERPAPAARLAALALAQ